MSRLRGSRKHLFAFVLATAFGACGILLAAWARRTGALRSSSREVIRLRAQRRLLQEKGRRVEEADRLKSTFIANMSHEIRTPLNSLLALSQMLRSGSAGPLTDEQRRYVEVIERNGQNLLKLINDVLDLSRIEAGHLELDRRVVDLGQLIHETAAQLAPLAEAKDLPLRVVLPKDLPPCLCDPDRVRQILTNLIGNAIKFTESGVVRVSAEASAGSVVVHVTDTGRGIPLSAQHRIFQEFFQADQTLVRRHAGTGLGLAIASRLTKLMGGDISFQSVEGAGARFTFTVPQAAGRPATVEGATAPEPTRAQDDSDGDHRAADAAPPENRALTVLVVEDNQDNLFTVREILAPLKLRIVTADVGAAAVEICRQNRPDLVLMDMQLPGMSGLQATGAIRRLPGCAGLPVVALTAQAMRGDRERMLAAGCDDYIAKPIDPTQLTQAVRRWIRGTNMRP